MVQDNILQPDMPVPPQQIFHERYLLRKPDSIRFQQTPEQIAFFACPPVPDALRQPAVPPGRDDGGVIYFFRQFILKKEQEALFIVQT